jgi:hypothetical protein
MTEWPFVLLCVTVVQLARVATEALAVKPRTVGGGPILLIQRK